MAVHALRNPLKAVLQVQPDRGAWDIWQTVAKRENLLYEVMEPIGEIETLLQANGSHTWYRNCGRTNALHGAFIDVNPASGDPEFKALSRKRCHQSCEFAAEIGADHVVFHSSCFPFLRGAYLEGWAGQCAEFYAQLSEKYNLKIFVENSMDLDPQPLRKLMEKTKSPAVGVCLDIGHAHYSLAPLEAWFDQLGEHIGYMHLSDNMGIFDEHLPLGKGNVEWAKADKMWRQLQGEIPMTLEVSGVDGVKESLVFMRKYGYFGLGE